MIKSKRLAFQEGNSDKFYNIAINGDGVVGDEGKYTVDFHYGRQGSDGQTGTKTKEPVTLTEAEKIYDKTVASKEKKGYQEV